MCNVVDRSKYQIIQQKLLFYSIVYSNSNTKVI